MNACKHISNDTWSQHSLINVLGQMDRRMDTHFENL